MKKAPTATAADDYGQYKAEGIAWYNEPHSENQGKSILQFHSPVIATSTAADIRLIGAWMAYWWGVDKAKRYRVRPSRGQTLVIETTHPIKVRIVDPEDHRHGVREIGDCAMCGEERALVSGTHSCVDCLQVDAEIEAMS